MKCTGILSFEEFDHKFVVRSWTPWKERAALCFFLDDEEKDNLVDDGMCEYYRYLLVDLNDLRKFIDCGAQPELHRKLVFLRNEKKGTIMIVGRPTPHEGVTRTISEDMAEKLLRAGEYVRVACRLIPTMDGPNGDEVQVKVWDVMQCEEKDKVWPETEPDSRRNGVAGAPSAGAPV